MKIRIVQMDVVKSIQINYQKAIDLATTKSLKSIDVLIFPEMFLTGFYEMKNIAKRSFTVHSQEIKFFKTLAKNTSTNIILGSLPIKKSSGIFNTSLVVNKLGRLIYQYDKINLFPLMNEDANLVRGDKMKVFKVDDFWGTIMICYDLRFPEILFNLHTKFSPEIIFLPMQWPYPRTEVFKTLVKARAIENQCFVISCNRVGRDRNNFFEGNSMVVEPNGKVKQLINSEEGAFDVTIIKKIVMKEREKFPFNLRRPKLRNY